MSAPQLRPLVLGDVELETQSDLCLPHMYRPFDQWSRVQSRGWWSNTGIVERILELVRPQCDTTATPELETRARAVR